jgi:hypothetical protein
MEAFLATLGDARLDRAEVDIKGPPVPEVMPHRLDVRERVEPRDFTLRNL